MIFHQQCLISVLTAEVFGSPVVGLATSMHTLSRELGHSVAQARGVCVFIFAIATVTEVCNTGGSERGNVQQIVAGVESRPCEDLLTQRFLQDGQTRENRERGA